MASQVVAVLDTAVLMRAGLTEFIVHLHLAGVCRVRWSAAIWQEWEARIHRRPPDVERRVLAALEQLDDPLLDVDEALDAAQLVFDGGDTHVAAAALAARVMVDGDSEVWGEAARVLLVTGNSRHFDRSGLAARGVEVVEPDAFGGLIIDRNPKAALRWVDPHRGDGLLQRMREDGLTMTAARIEVLLSDLDL